MQSPISAGTRKVTVKINSTSRLASLSRSMSRKITPETSARGAACPRCDSTGWVCEDHSVDFQCKLDIAQNRNRGHRLKRKRAAAREEPPLGNA